MLIPITLAILLLRIYPTGLFIHMLNDIYRVIHYHIIFNSKKMETMSIDKGQDE